MTITKEEREAWKAAAEAASPAPWTHSRDPDATGEIVHGVNGPAGTAQAIYPREVPCLADVTHEWDAEFVCIARDAVPRLIAALEER